MATTTPNFGWIVPTSTDLVKDGATAIETLGDGVDASFVGLKGGTTGQVLSKTSGTDLAFTWVAQDDSNAIQNAIVDAKGDLIAATAADTPARLAVGTNGQVLQADSTESTGLKWATMGGAGVGFVSTDTFSAVTTLSLNSKFTSTYECYRIVVDFTNGGGTQSLLMRMRAGGTDTTSGIYGFYSPVGTWSGSSATEGRIGTVPPSGSVATVFMDIARPFDTKITSITGLYQFTSGASIGEISPFGMVVNNTTSYDGFTIYSGGNSFTGRVSIYGYNLS